MDNQSGEHHSVGIGTGKDDQQDGISLKHLRTFRSLKHPVYRLYYMGMVGQMASMNMQIFTRTWLLKHLTNSTLIVGAMSFAHSIPVLLFSLFGGAIADRIQKRHIIVSGQVVSTIISLGVALALLFDFLSAGRSFTVLGITLPSWSILVIASVFQGTVMALMMPSIQSILPEIVGEEHLMNAISLNTMGMNILRIIAPAATGFLLEAFDYDAVYFVISFMYAMSAFFFSFLPPTRKVELRDGESAIASIMAGVDYLRKQKTVLLIALLSLIAVLLSMPYQMYIPFFCVDILHIDEGGGGVLMGVSGVGAIISSLILASLPNKKRGFMMLISGIILGLSLAGFSFSGSLALSLGFIAFVGTGQSGSMTLGTTLIQYYVEKEFRGRVMSILMMQFGIVSLGAFIAGVAAEVIGIQWAIGSMALLLIFLSILAFIFLPRMRRLD